MKILKTSALAAILCVGSITANATTYDYDGTDDFTIEVGTATALTVAVADSTLTFQYLVPGDEISGASLGVTITGSNTLESSSTGREIVCSLSGGINMSGSTVGSGNSVTTLLTTSNDASGNTIATLTIGMTDACSFDTSGVVNTLSISSDTITDYAQPGQTYDSGTITFTASYTVNTAIATYS